MKKSPAKFRRKSVRSRRLWISSESSAVGVHGRAPGLRLRLHGTPHSTAPKGMGSSEPKKSKSIQTVAKGKLDHASEMAYSSDSGPRWLYSALSVPAHASKMDDQNYIIR